MPVCARSCPSLWAAGWKIAEDRGKRARDHQVATWHPGFRRHRSGGIVRGAVERAGTVLEREAAVQTLAPTSSRSVRELPDAAGPSRQPGGDASK